MELRYPNGERVRLALETVGASRRQIAREVGIAPGTVRRLEQGRRVLASSLRRFARFMGTTSEAFVDPEIDRLQLEFTFDLALSYVSRDRAIAAELAALIGASGFTVFFDRSSQEIVWGSRLDRSLGRVFEFEARYCIALLSESYLHSPWAQLELKHILKRMNRSDAVYLLPVRLDDVEVPQIPEAIAFLDFRSTSIREVCEIFAKKALHDARSERRLHARQAQ